MIGAPKSVNVKLSLPLLEISGTWEPNTAERQAPWELYVELITRITVVPLGDDEGLLREALTGLYSMFPTTRDVLRRHGPELATPKPDGQYNLGYLAVAMLNQSRASAPAGALAPGTRRLGTPTPRRPLPP